MKLKILLKKFKTLELKNKAYDIDLSKKNNDKFNWF